MHQLLSIPQSLRPLFPSGWTLIVKVLVCFDMLFPHKADQGDKADAKRGNKQPAVSGNPVPHTLHRFNNCPYSANAIEHVIALKCLRGCACTEQPGKNALQ